jgi:hypothetical protein
MPSKDFNIEQGSPFSAFRSTTTILACADSLYQIIQARSRSNLYHLQVIETASGLTPKDEAAFMRQRASAASSTVTEAFQREVSVYSLIFAV